MGKWVRIGGMGVVCLAGIGAGAYFALQDSGTGTTRNDTRETPAQAADRRVGELLGDARAAIDAGNFTAAETALAEAETLVQQHDLAQRRTEIASLRTALAEKRRTPPPATAGSWPAHPELRRAVDDTIRRIAPERR